MTDFIQIEKEVTNLSYSVKHLRYTSITYKSEIEKVLIVINYLKVWVLMPLITYYRPILACKGKFNV